MCVQGQAAAKVMSPAEMAEYEEKKLKMRKAMGENLHDDVQGMVPPLWPPAHHKNRNTQLHIA